MEDTRENEYGRYLALSALLTSQNPQSKPSHHDEMLFIIVHQIYELWFKQIHHELDAIIQLFASPQFGGQTLGRIVGHTARITQIQALLLDQMTILDSMTAADFLDFRGALGNASGFQSQQFRELERQLGNSNNAAPAAQTRTSLTPTHTLFQVVESWLESLPDIIDPNFNFSKHYQQAVLANYELNQQRSAQQTQLSSSARAQQLLQHEAQKKQCLSLINPADYQKWRATGCFHLSNRALLSALFINLYRHEPLLQQAFTLLSHLVTIDQRMQSWRSRHIQLVQRMIGGKVGTGGSTGSGYLETTLNKPRPLRDLSMLSGFLVPQVSLPPLPLFVQRKLDYHFYHVTPHHSDSCA